MAMNALLDSPRKLGFGEYRRGHEHRDRLVKR
jgi:hypothetical protein